MAIHLYLPDATGKFPVTIAGKRNHRAKPPPRLKSLHKGILIINCSIIDYR